MMLVLMRLSKLLCQPNNPEYDDYIILGRYYDYSTRGLAKAEIATNKALNTRRL